MNREYPTYTNIGPNQEFKSESNMESDEIAVEEMHLEVLSTLRQLVGSELLFQLWNGPKMLSFVLHYGVALMRNLRHHQFSCRL
jgi:hypothetical protein